MITRSGLRHPTTLDVCTHTADIQLTLWVCDTRQLSGVLFYYPTTIVEAT